MKWVRVPLLLLGVMMCSQGFAATAQQEKMKTCNADATAKALKGDERKAFMSDCLKAKPATQQEKMKTCNADASTKALKGDERKAFMSDCLKKK
ncbi:phosphate starvation-inducible protein PsiF [Pseudomonas sp. JQ170]|uniref:PsiF family protein n=1 Tax=unclassified Pseudomonas TaxID=196821 RepID=UPI00264CFFC1|nr:MULTISPECIES: PsiF family protein [unclassified Pseudomonas]MDN7140231.1 phosphate starvation-inducible protein PsiF [Pseudomonas sp. JQ170]WRO76582.1 PsiF family protein [Pseudomonas sp. 170C]